MRARVAPQPVVSAAILVLWLVLAPAWSVAQLLLGVLLALVIPRLTRRFWPERPLPAHLRRGIRLALVVLYDIVVANWQVARLVLGPLRRIRPAFLEVPLDVDDALAVTILGSIVSLTPGTVSIEIDREHRRLLVHALDAPDPEALIARIKARYEQPLEEIFRC